MKEGDLRIWHIPQIPMKPFHVPVESVAEAKKIIWTLWQYDLFQYENNIKPDYANATGLQVFENGEWVDWENDEGDSIDELMRQDRENNSGHYLFETA